MRWIERRQGDFGSKPSPAPERGTSIILHLREDAEEYPQRLEAQAGHCQILRPHQPAHPDGKEEWKDGELINPNDENGGRQPGWSRPASGKPSTRPAPCGRAPKKDITEEQYAEFYKTISHDHEAPLTWAHNRVEGNTEYAAAVHPRQGTV